MSFDIDLRPVLLVSGVLLAILGSTMILPALIDLSASNPDWQVFAGASVLTLLVGFALYFAMRGAPRELSTRQALLMTTVAWLLLVLFGAIPYWWSGIVPSFTDAFFESMSGLTTTGATVIVGLDRAPPGILFWRGLQQWLGGLGIIVMAVSVLPMLQIGGMQLFKAEAFDTPEKILPRATQLSGFMTLIFIGITALCAVAYVLAGMTVSDGVIHAMTTVATGGFSTKDASIGYYRSAAIDWIAIIFMIIGSIPFLLIVKSLQGRIGSLVSDAQVRGFLLTLGVATVIAWIMADLSNHHDGLEALRFAAFNVVSTITGTGYATTNYGLWGAHTAAFFFVILFIGGCAGSSSCGIKIFRFQILFANIRKHLYEIVYPNGIFVKRFNGYPVDERATAAVMSFFFLFFASFIVFAILISLTGVDITTALSGAGSALANVGPGIGELIGPSGNYKSLNDTAKWLLSAAMLLGRLELFTVLVVFMPRFWRN